MNSSQESSGPSTNSDPLMNIALEESPPKNAPLAAKYKRSFAYPSMKDRCPVILSKIVDLLYRDKLTIIKLYGDESQEEIKQVIGEISSLKNQLQTGKPFDLFSSSEPDTEIWNSHLIKRKEKGDQLNYYETDWLFAECYLYRKIREIFATKKHLHSFDPFLRQKSSLLEASLPAIVPILNYLEQRRLFDSSQKLGKQDVENELTKLFKCALWANRLDLSLSGGNIDVNDDVFNLVNTWDSNILVNHLHRAVSIISTPKDSSRIIEYVMDNSGLEALCDFFLADFLITWCNVRRVNFRVKPFPWFVSDVTVNDFHHILSMLIGQSDPLLQKYGRKWKNHLESGSWGVTSDVFWCLGLPCTDMPAEDPPLYSALSKASLIILKGDLNYRKLVGDTNWEPTTPFSTALGNFHPAPLVALRTSKADTLAGLEPGVAERMATVADDWMVSGNYALIQFDQP